MAALVGVLAAVASTERLDVKAMTNRKETIKARMACMAGIQRFIATEANDLLGGGATTSGSTSGSTSTIAMTTGATTLQDDWAQLGANGGTNGDERALVDDISFRMQVVDACSYVNMSKLSPAAAAATPGQTITATQAPWLSNLPLSQQQIDAFYDFTTPGENATADGGKDPYYNALANPYNAKLAPLDTLDELLQIRYFDANAIYQPNTNIVSTVTYTAGTNGQQPTLYDLLTPYSYAPNLKPGALGSQSPLVGLSGLAGNPTVQTFTGRGIPQNVANDLVGAFTRTPRPTTMGALVRFLTNPTSRNYVVNNCTFQTGTRTAGLINVNTASVNVLTSMPNMTPDLAQAIVTQQQSGFTQMSDLFNVAGYTTAIAGSTIDNFCVESSTFIVRVIGTCGSTSVAMEATVDIVNNKPQLVRIADVPFTDAIGRWNWNSTTSTDTVLKEAS
jgi:hypothetical protein